ncbi:unnamed protein product [Orchesella dallaii]|uniref:Gustatory receptor n=1 Tax=Orchesella dallaii TaxID=48710 RepID=A0ABP1RTG8_9HEXA
MSRDLHTEKVFEKSLRDGIVRINAQVIDLDKQGKTPISTRKLELFHWYFLAAYYGLIIPFKIQKREDDKVWETKSWMFQKLLCFIIFRPLIWLGILTRFALVVRKFYANKDYRPKDYLEFATNTLYFANLFNFSWTLIIRREKLEKLFNNVSAFSLFHLEKPSVPLSSRVSRRTKWFLTAYMVGLFVFCIAFYVIRRTFYNTSFQRTIQNGRKRFFLVDWQSNVSLLHINRTNDTHDIYSNVNFLVAFAQLALSISELWYRVFVVTFFSGALPVTFWSASKLFQRYLSGIDTLRAESLPLNESFDSSLADMIVEKYEELKNLVASLNSVWSTATLVYVICKSVELVVYSNRKVMKKDVVHLFAFVCFTFFFVVMLILLAEGCRMNDSIKLWLYKTSTREQVFVEQKSELECLKMDFEVAPVGIGTFGVCVISYGFLSQLLVFCVTVFLITF